MLVLIACIWIPLLLILIGKVLLDLKTERNWVFGYRTAMSMKSDEAWEYAQKSAGNYFIYMGIAETLIMLMIYIILRGSLTDYIGLVEIGELISLMGVILYTEIQLRKVFDKNGNKKADLK